MKREVENLRKYAENHKRINKNLINELEKIRTGIETIGITNTKKRLEMITVNAEKKRGIQIIIEQIIKTKGPNIRIIRVFKTT